MLPAWTRCCATPASAISSPTRTASCSPSRGRATASMRRSCAPTAAWPPWAATPSRPSRSGAPSRAIPATTSYRDFYRDVGFDLDYDYLKPHLHQTGIRSLLGIKYYKITGRTDDKQPYDPQAALEKAAEHAGNFMFNREKQVEWLAGSMDGRPSLIVAPYDAELFGHWWFEGPDWINFLLRKLHYDQQTIKTITVPEYLDRHPHDPGVAADHVELGLQGLQRGVAGRVQRLDLSPPARGRRPHGGDGRSNNPSPDGLRRRAPQPGRPRAAAGAIQRLGVHHEDGHDGGIRPRADARPRQQLQPPVRTRSSTTRSTTAGWRRSSAGTTCSRTSTIASTPDLSQDALFRRGRPATISRI